MTQADHQASKSGLGQRKNFSIRLPASLYQQLEALSERTGNSMNKLIGNAVAVLVKRPDLAPTEVGNDINAQIARDAVRQGLEAIGPLKGIAKHASNRDQVALACVIWAAAARLVEQADGPERAAEELNHSAQIAETSNRIELAIALYEEALKLDPNNLEAENRLGQRLHHLASQHGDDIDRYREAERHLSRVTFVDNHAKLFHGWSALYVAKADSDPYRRDHALGEIDDALKSWAFGQRSGPERPKWLRQVRRLAEAGYRDRAAALLEFANRNAKWGSIDHAELNAPPES